MYSMSIFCHKYFTTWHQPFNHMLLWIPLWEVIFQSFHCGPWKWYASWKWEQVRIRFWTFVSFFLPQAASLKAFLTLPQASAGHPEPLCLRLRAPLARDLFPHEWWVGDSPLPPPRSAAHPPLMGDPPPMGVGPSPAVGRAQFPHSYKQISTPPPPIPLITVATAMIVTATQLAETC